MAAVSPKRSITVFILSTFNITGISLSRLLCTLTMTDIKFAEVTRVLSRGVEAHRVKKHLRLGTTSFTCHQSVRVKLIIDDYSN